jgi:hypothetical protein
MADVTDRVLALAQLKTMVQDTVKPTLSSSDLDDLLDSAMLPQVKRASTWTPNALFFVNQIVLPSKRNGHRYRCVRAGVTDNAALNGLVGLIQVTAGGSGYTSAPSVALTGGGGSGATALAVVQSGMVVAVYLTNQGGGYTSAPSVGFSGGGGTGAAATANITGSEPTWPKAQGATVQEGLSQPDGTVLTWREDGPDFDNIYDVRLAAHRGWLLKAERASSMYQTSMGGQAFQRQQIYEHCVAMALQFAPCGF